MAVAGCSIPGFDSTPVARRALGTLAPMFEPPPTTAVVATSTTTIRTTLVAWTGPVEHIFFHTLVIDPQLAFTNDQLGKGFQDYFVTEREFKAILTQLYANGWTLVDIHRAVNGTVMVSPGRKPLVLSEDDVNYYDYEHGHGLGWRLALDPTGNVKVEVRDSTGVHLTDDDLVPLVDEFVAAHPDFSADGAKGVLALTGYEGLFGERIEETSSPGDADAVVRATAIADRLKATGWVLASHSYGHLNLTTNSTATIRYDTDRWLKADEPITGPTDVYVYPFGSRPSPATIAMLRSRGFAILCDIDTVARVRREYGVSIMARRHIDGFAFAGQVANLAKFFDVATVEDRADRAVRCRCSSGGASP
jgi:hypothetical protein